MITLRQKNKRMDCTKALCTISEPLPDMHVYANSALSSKPESTLTSFVHPWQLNCAIVCVSRHLTCARCSRTCACSSTPRYLAFTDINFGFDRTIEMGSRVGPVSLKVLLRFHIFVWSRSDTRANIVCIVSRNEPNLVYCDVRVGARDIW